MAKNRKEERGNLATKKAKYIFDVNDFIIANGWTYKRPGNDFFDKDYIEIIEFFCFHSPCKQGSYSPCNLESIGWQNPWQSSKFRDHLDVIAGFNHDNFKCVENQYEFRELWEQSHYPDNFTTKRAPFALFAEAGEHNKYMDLFHRIRNGFAHGRYNVIRDHGEYYLYFEDVKGTNGHEVVLARICLTKSILNNWRLFLTMKSPDVNDFRTIIPLPNQAFASSE